MMIRLWVLEGGDGLRCMIGVVHSLTRNRMNDKVLLFLLLGLSCSLIMVKDKKKNVMLLDPSALAPGPELCSTTSQEEFVTE